MAPQHVVHLKSPGPRPAFYLVAHHLWGADCNIDSDGNSSTPDDDSWTELSLFLREASSSEQIQVDPVSDDPLVLAIRSPSAALCERVASYLAHTTGGTIAHAT